ncbi:MAG: DUF1232 domain-containing protein [Rhodospirillaceae bacterium]|nr:DUF1232 domain-containing protein [Rhodospirillales bacterium]
MDIQNVDPVKFWKKVRDTAGKVPFLDEVVAVWYCARDPATPIKAKAILLGAVAYFVLPFDVVPDVIAGLGYADDLAILMAAIRAIRPHITDAHRIKAREALDAKTASR